jgi:subtilisin family serine protease
MKKIFRFCMIFFTIALMSPAVAGVLFSDPGALPASSGPDGDWTIPGLPVNENGGLMGFSPNLLPRRTGANNLSGSEPAHTSGELLVKLRVPPGTARSSSAAKVFPGIRGTVKRDFARVTPAGTKLSGLYLVRIPDTADIAAVKAKLDADPRVEYTSYNYIRHIFSTPDDPLYSQEWGLHNTGQTGGLAGADIRGPESWDITTGSPTVVIAVIDTGVDYRHPDLAQNIWTNPGEIPDNGIDDDANGFIDDYHGWDFGMNDKDPMDVEGHGTHCAGTIGAAGNNAIGVTGVNWKVSIMPLKAVDFHGQFTDSSLIDSINYASMMNASVISASWGGNSNDAAMKEAIEASGALFVAAAGNDGLDNDIIPVYPSGYNSTNVLSVAASDANDSRIPFSNWGKTTVDIAAPGVDILSTRPDQYMVTNPVFSEDFSTLDRWQNMGKRNWTLNTSSYTSPPSSVATGNFTGTTYYLMLKAPVTISGMSNPTLQYSLKGLLGSDTNYFLVFASTDNTSYNALGQTVLTGNPGDWKNYSSSLIDYSNKPLYLILAVQPNVAVPGTGIWVDDLVIGNGTDPVPRYVTMSGTSMATPHVAGVAGQIKALNPAMSAVEIKNRILSSGDSLPGWQGLTVTGRRLDAFRALSIPQTGFSGTPRSGTAPVEVSFSDLSTGRPTGWAWYFGDESYSAPWTRATPGALWTGRSSHTTVGMPDGSIILAGGESGPGVYGNDVWRSADGGATWTLAALHAGWSARSGQSSLAMPDGSVLLMGGYGGTFSNDVWRSTDGGITWTQITAHAGWPARSGQACVVATDGSLVLTGGYNGSWLNDTWRSVDNGLNWSRVNAGAGWSARSRMSSVALPDGSILLMGGGQSEGSAPATGTNDVWRSADKGATWTRVTADAGWPARSGQGTVAMADGSIVLAAGNGTSYNNDTWRSTDKGATWTLLAADAGWPARSGLGMAAMPDGTIVVTGGCSSSGCMNDVWRLPTAGSSEKNPVHSYANPGSYTVTLQASDAYGYSTLRRAGYISIAGPQPTAGADNDDGGPAPAAVASTGTVNVGGDSAVSRAEVRGTGVSGFILTGMVIEKPAGEAPPGIVYQYLDLAPARYTTITGATVFFSVPRAWLDEHGFAPAGIVLYHETPAGWVALPTTFLDEENEAMTFSAETSGFSPFAIAGAPAPAATNATGTPAIQPVPVTTIVPRSPVTLQTTTAPVPAVDLEPSPPLFIIVAGILVAIVLLAVVGYLIRRWWIRRQNPALFRDYD